MFKPRETNNIFFMRFLSSAMKRFLLGIFLTTAVIGVVGAASVEPAQAQRIIDSSTGNRIQQAVKEQAEKNAENDEGWFDFLYPSYWVPLALSWLFAIVIHAVGTILTIFINILVWVAQYNNFIHELPVVTGWIIVRDISNMFFVLFLLIIAFGTVLRMPNYQLQNTLPKILLMAILINFSRTICGLIIDFAQVVMLTFVNSFVGITGGADVFGSAKIVETLGIHQILTIQTTGEGLAQEGIDILAVAGGYILALVFLVIATVIIAAMAIALVYRIIMLWIYVILSPLAFILSAVPGGQGYASQWWSEFTKNVVFGPILAFFLWLTFATVSNVDLLAKIDDRTAVDQSLQTTTGTANESAKNLEAGILQATSTTFMIKFIVAIGMLLGGMQVAAQAGGAAGGAASRMYGRGIDISKWTGKKAGGVAWGGAKGAWSLSKAAGKGVDNALLGGKVNAGIQRVKNVPGAAVGAGLGTAIGGPVGTVVGGLLGGLAGKAAKNRFDQYIKQQRARRNAVKERGTLLNERKESVNNIDDANLAWKADEHAYHEVYKKDGKAVTTNIGAYIKADGTAAVRADEDGVVGKWDDEYKAYLHKDPYKENGSIFSRYGELSLDDEKYRIRDSKEGVYYKVNNEGQFVDQDGKATTDRDKMQAMQSAVLGRKVKTMGTGWQKFYDGMLSERAVARTAAQMAENEKIQDIAKQYSGLSKEEVARLLDVEHDDDKKMAIALVAAQKGGLDSVAAKDKGREAVRGNAALLDAFNESMNKNHAFINHAYTEVDANGNQRVVLDQAGLTRAISSGKVKLSDQSTEDLAKIPKSIDFMAEQLGGKLQSTLDSMVKTKNDKVPLTNALMSGVQERGFKDNDFQIRKAAAALSGDFIEASKDANNNNQVDAAQLQRIIKQTSKAEVFGDVKESNMKDSTFQVNFGAAIGINQLTAMARSADVNEEQFREYVAMVTDPAKRQKMQDNNVLSAYV